MGIVKDLDGLGMLERGAEKKQLEKKNKTKITAGLADGG